MKYHTFLKILSLTFGGLGIVSNLLTDNKLSVVTLLFLCLILLNSSIIYEGMEEINNLSDRIDILEDEIYTIKDEPK